MDSLSTGQFQPPNIQHEKYTSFFNSLKIIYKAMDQKYKEAADYYGFNCNGCEDNCCTTRFYHHTLLEYLYILKEFNSLENEKQINIKHRALDVCRKTIEADEKGMPVRLMCPLNFDGLCILYNYRPMICRLHGIPSELHRPEQQLAYSPGCDAFSKQSGNKDYIQFDRTPFYVKMAELEKKLKKAVGITQKIKMTVAQMLVAF